MKSCDTVIILWCLYMEWGELKYHFVIGIGEQHMYFEVNKITNMRHNCSHLF